MKTFWLLSLVCVVTLNAVAHPAPLLNNGPLSIKLLATSQGLDNATVVDKTNSTASTTTVTMISKSTISNSFVQTIDLLTLLQNSYNTTFDAGSQVVVSRTGSFLHLWVVDSTG